MLRGNRLKGSLAALMVISPAMAQETSEGAFKFRGFGTLGVVRSSEKNADFQPSYALPDGAGYTRSIDWKDDTRLGVQGDLRFSESFSAVVQVIGEHRYDGTFSPYLSMAHLKFQPIPSLAFRAGRVPLSTYLISDYQKVGYSTPWVRPPIEVYQFNPLIYFDGADLMWKVNAGSVAISTQVFGGSTSVKVPQTGVIADFKAKSMVGGNVTGVFGSSTLRAFYLQLKATLDNSVLDGAAPYAGLPTGPFSFLRYSGPIPTNLPAPYPPFVPNPYYNPALADQFQIKDKKITYTSLGYSYDPGDWLVMAEVARNAGDEVILLHTTTGYLTVAYHAGAWTPSFTVAHKKMDSPTSNANPIVNQLLALNDHAQKSLSAGLRWDFHPKMDLKLQVDRVTDGEHSYGAFINNQSSFKVGQSYTLISATLDFVF